MDACRAVAARRWVDLVIVDLGARREDLQPNRMPRFETARWHALGGLPTRCPTIVRRNVRCGVESQARDDGVSMAVARVNRDPFAATLQPESPEVRRTHGRRDQPGAAQHVGDGPRTIVGIVFK